MTFSASTQSSRQHVRPKKATTLLQTIIRQDKASTAVAPKEAACPAAPAPENTPRLRPRAQTARQPVGLPEPGTAPVVGLCVEQSSSSRSISRQLSARLSRKSLSKLDDGPSMLDEPLKKSSIGLSDDMMTESTRAPSSMMNSGLCRDIVKPNRMCKTAREVGTNAQTSNLLKEKHQVADGFVMDMRGVGKPGRNQDNETDGEVYKSLLAQPLKGNKMPARRSATPARIPRKAAFTDRSLRMREGVHMRENMSGQEFGFGGYDQIGCNSFCSCPICKPFDMKPAGAASKWVSSNMVNSMFSNEDQARNSNTFESNSAKSLLSDRDFSPPSATNSLELSRSIGNKRRINRGTASQHRSFSEEPRVAGTFRPVGFLVEDEHGQSSFVRHRPQNLEHLATSSHVKSGVAMVLKPEANDPEVSKALTASGRKASGEFKGRITTETVKAPMRSQSVPPLRDSRRNIITHEGCDELRSSVVDKSWCIRKHGVNNSSNGVAETINHERIARQHVALTEARMANEHAFADLCMVTSQVARNNAEGAEKNRASGLNNSRGVAISLCWPEGN